MGLEGVNYHTLADFRVQHAEALGKLFVEVLGIMSAEGLITLERVMHDGTKVLAHAGADTFRREGWIRTHLELANQQVRAMSDPRQNVESGIRVAKARERAAREKKEKLERALLELSKIRATKRSEKEKEEARASVTDPEARIMLQSNGGYAPSYNVQISTDAASQAIVGLAVSQAPADYKELVPAIEQIEANLGQKPDQMVVDGGYTTRENILKCDEQGVDLIASLGKGNAQSEIKKPYRHSFDGRSRGHPVPLKRWIPNELKGSTELAERWLSFPIFGLNPRSGYGNFNSKDEPKFIVRCSGPPLPIIFNFCFASGEQRAQRNAKEEEVTSTLPVRINF